LLERTACTELQTSAAINDHHRRIHSIENIVTGVFKVQ
jgi:hypothetical protein